MYAPTQTAAPATTPVTRDEAKAQCQIESTDTSFDALVQVFLDAATAHLDGYAGILGRCIVTQSWKQEFDDFAQCLRLPMPAATIASITYLEDDGTTTTTVGTSNYALHHDALGSYVRFVDSYSFPSGLWETKAVAVTFAAGYGTAAAVPAAIKAAVLLLVAHWFANREAVNVGNIVSELPFAVAALITPYRRVGI